MNDPASTDAPPARVRDPRARAEPGARIRPAVPRDARALAAIMKGIYREGRWFVGDDAPGAAGLARRLRSADPDADLWVVAEDATGLLGWAELHRLAPRRMRHVATLTLAVDAAARGRGVGRSLLRGTYDWARRVGVRRIRLDVREHNEAARRLYESEGFEPEGRERAQIRTPEGYEDNLLMARFLDEERGRDGR